MTYTKILIGIDGSEDSKRAVKKAIELQKDWGCEIVAFHSVEHHMVADTLRLTVPITNTFTYQIPAQDYTQIRQAYVEAGKKIIADAKQMFEDAQAKAEVRLIKQVDPDDYIKTVVDKENFDLVILGCKGKHSKLKEIFVGSIAQKVVNQVPVDTLIVR